MSYSVSSIQNISSPFSASAGLTGHRILDLQHAICQGNAKAVSNLIQEGYYPRQRNTVLELPRLPNGQWPLHQAIRSGQPQIAAFLIENGVDPSLKDEQGLSAIDLAFLIGDRNLIVKVLGTQIGNEVLEARHQIQSEDTAAYLSRFRKEIDQIASFKDKPLPLHCSISYEGLLNGTPWLARTDENGFLPLHYAAIRNDIQGIEVLANSSLAVSGIYYPSKEQTGPVLTANGASPLHLAAASGSVETILRLIELGFDPNQPNALGQTPLHYAAIGDQLLAFKALASKGARVHLLDKEGLSPLALFGATAAARDPLSVSSTELALFGASSLYWLSRAAAAPAWAAASLCGVELATLASQFETVSEMVQGTLEKIETFSESRHLPLRFPKGNPANHWFSKAAAAALLGAAYAATPWYSLPIQAYATYLTAAAAFKGLQACVKNKDYRRKHLEMKISMHGMNLMMPLFATATRLFGR